MVLLPIVKLAVIGAVAAVSLDPSRPYLDKLVTKNQVKESDFIEPYLIAQTAVAVTRPAAETTSRLRAYLQKSELPLRGHFAPKGSSKSDTPDVRLMPLPKEATKDKQLRGINECTKEYCAVKLNDDLEKTIMTKAAVKLAAYQQLIVERVRRYLKNRELIGYEDRSDNRKSFAKMLDVLPFMKSRYPACTRYFSETFWNSGAAGECKIQDSFLKMELLSFGPPDKLQPILRISEVFEVGMDKGASLFVEVHVYSNHYFDSSVRIYEVIPISEGASPRSILSFTDVMEIDELKKSGLIRFLYKGKMEEAISDFQSEQIAEIK